MTLQEALRTRQYVRRASNPDGGAFCWHEPKTGPYKDVVECDYFSFYEDGFLTFSTSAPDMYASEILADDYEVVQFSPVEIQQAFERTEALRDR